MKASVRRSMLYVPGDSEKMIRRSATVPSDVLLLNLEDGISASRKNEARNILVNAMKEVRFGAREIVVRINPLDTETGLRDLSQIIPLRPDAVCLPKIESAAQIAAADQAIRELEIRHRAPEGSIALHAMIESASGVLHAAEIASASHRMASLIFGSADFSGDVRCRPGGDRAEIALALQMIVLSARSAGIEAIDAPCFDIRDPDLLQQESLQARRLGFDGKSALHPDQLEIINRAFETTPEEIAWAERVLAGLDEAETRGKALTTVDGKLLDNPHRAAAERILKRRTAR